MDEILDDFAIERFAAKGLADHSRQLVQSIDHEEGRRASSIKVRGVPSGGEQVRHVPVQLVEQGCRLANFFVLYATDKV
jgi:hypothetical protein